MKYLILLSMLVFIGGTAIAQNNTLTATSSEGHQLLRLEKTGGNSGNIFNRLISLQSEE